MFKQVAMFVLAVVAGYATMILGIFGAQEGLFGGVTWQDTPLPQLLVAGVLTTASAVMGGAVAAWVYGQPFYPPVLLMCGLVVAETIYMTLAGRLPGPLWFDAAASGSLVFGMLLGVFIASRWKPWPAPAASIDPT